MAAGPIDGAPAPAQPKEHHRMRFSTRQYAIGAAVGIVLVAVLMIALRFHAGTDRRRYESVLKGVLDRLVTAQEGFYYDSTHYASSLRALPGVQLPQGTHVQLFNPDSKSWWGVATHDLLPRRHCVVWVGTPPSSLPVDARAPDDETKPLCFDGGTAARQSPHS